MGDDQNIVCTDVRFDNEAEALHNAGFLTIKRQGDTSLNDVDRQHESERGIDEKYIDYTLGRVDPFDKLEWYVDKVITNIGNQE